MAVYVDDMWKKPMGQYRRMKMSHLWANTELEMITMADHIGVKRKHFQYPGTPKAHFDICLSKRALAVRAGAIEVSMRELRRLMLVAEHTAKQVTI